MKADLLIINASELLTLKTGRGFKTGSELLDLGAIENGAVAVMNGKIAAAGKTGEIIRKFPAAKKTIDAKNCVVMPGLVDCHTHLVYAGSRSHEYEAKIMGKSYAEMHQDKGKTGILYTVEKTRKAGKKELVKNALTHLEIMLRHGTTTVEAKSGYGLDRENEIKILEAAGELNRLQPVDVIPTFLGAHTVPEEYRNDRAGCVALLKKLLPEIKNRNMAEFCDVFCDRLGFTVEESREIIKTAKDLGFRIKLHAEQTGYLGGARLGAEFDAVSCDHLDYLTDEDMKLLAEKKIAGVLLPAVTWHLMEASPNPAKNYEIAKPFWPERARKMIESGMIIALATDYNPGSCPAPLMKTAMECAARIYRLRPAEIISASTINAAYALGRQDSVGSLETGKKADVIILDCPDHRELVNSMGVNPVNCVIKNGKVAFRNGNRR